MFENVQESAPALDLVSLEKEIVTKRLMDTAVEVQKHRSFRNIILVLLGSAVLLALVLYNRFPDQAKAEPRTESEECADRADEPIAQAEDITGQDEPAFSVQLAQFHSILYYGR